MPATARFSGQLTEGALAVRLQAVTRLGISAPGGVPERADGARAPLETTVGDAGATADTSATTGRAELAGLPDVRLWGGRLAQAVSEVLVGDRPISQLVRFTNDRVFLELNRRVRLLGMNTTAGSRGAKEKSTVRSVRVFMPEADIAEVAAHVRHGERSRAVALRLEVRRNRWVCTALELG
ncbi:Rv3235 family protein [Kribbella sp. WER1]